MTSSTRPPTRDQLLACIDRFSGTEVLVIADLVLDAFEYGTIGRISREAPVLILDHVRTDYLPGGGANAACNLAFLEGQALLVGRVGDDEEGRILVGLLRERGIDTSGIWRDSQFRTPVKRRILGGSAQSVKQQLVRIDSGGGPAVDPGDAPLLATLRDLRPRAAGALISDYSLGLFHAGTITPVLEALSTGHITLFADSRRQLPAFHGLTAATPNLPEAEEALDDAIGDDFGRLERGGAALRKQLDAEAILLTRGSRGMSLFTRDHEPVHLPVYGTDEVADVTGAGDTVIGVFCLGRLSGSSFVEAAILSNYAGGIVVMKRGTACVSLDELREAVRTDPEFGRGSARP